MQTCTLPTYAILQKIRYTAGKALFDLRMEEINIAGKSYNLAEGEKKDLPASKISTTAKRGVR